MKKAQKLLQWWELLFGLFENMFFLVCLETCFHVWNMFLQNLINFIFTWKTICCYCPKFTKSLWRSNRASISKEAAHLFRESLSQCCGHLLLQETQKHPMLVYAVLACPPHQSCVWALHNQLSHWFWSKNLQLFSGTALGSDGQMTSRGSKVNSNLNSPAWPTSCKHLSPKSLWVQNAQIKTSNYFNDPPQMLKSRLFEAEKASERSRWFIAEY